MVAQLQGGGSPGDMALEGKPLAVVKLAPDLVPIGGPDK